MRPSYWDIVLAYVREGHAAWRESRPASAVEIERSLGLNAVEGMDFIRHLEARGLVSARDIPMNNIGAYRLLPAGLAFAEGIPSLEQLLWAEAERIDALNATAEQRTRAKTSMREIVIKRAMEHGTDKLLESWPIIYRLLRTQFPWLPELPA
jgi:hypothetical protein